MKKFAVALFAVLAFASAAQAAQVCTVVTRPTGGTYLACKNVPGSTTLPKSTDESQPVEAAAGSDSASSAVASSSAQSSQSLQDNDKTINVQFAAPVSTSVPVTGTQCIKTDSHAASFLIGSVSKTEQTVVAFCAYMQMYQEYARIGAFSKAVEMLNKAEESIK